MTKPENPCKPKTDQTITRLAERYNLRPRSGEIRFVEWNRQSVLDYIQEIGDILDDIDLIEDFDVDLFTRAMWTLLLARIIWIAKSPGRKRIIRKLRIDPKTYLIPIPIQHLFQCFGVVEVNNGFTFVPNYNEKDYEGIATEAELITVDNWMIKLQWDFEMGHVPSQKSGTFSLLMLAEPTNRGATELISPTNEAQPADAFIAAISNIAVVDQMLSYGFSYGIIPNAMSARHEFITSNRIKAREVK